MTTLTVDTRDPFEVLRPLITVRGARAVLRELRQTTNLDPRALSIAARDFVPRSKQQFAANLRDIERRFVAKLKTRITYAYTNHTVVTPTDIPLPLGDNVSPTWLLPATAENVDRNKFWLAVQETAHRAWDFCKRADRLLFDMDRWEVAQTYMDTLTEILAVHMKQLVGVWADFRDSFRAVDQLVGSTA